MKAYEIMTDIVSERFYSEHPDTVDKIKCGDENTEVTKIATCLTASPDIIRAAADWGAELIITHEPTFYNHADAFYPTKLSLMKKELLEKLGLTVYRYHDSMHGRDTDEVNEDFISRCGLKGQFDKGLNFVSDEPLCATELARLCADRLGLKHPRIVGAPDAESRHIALATGARGSQLFTEFVDSEDCNIAICGELCEWYDCEPVRDASQFGIKKAIIILGHAGSEKAAMETLAESIDKKYDGARAKYFDCGEIYTYAD